MATATAGRRGFFKKTLAGAVLLAGAGAVPLALRKTKLRSPPAGRTLLFFSPAEYAIFSALADTVLAVPAGDAKLGAAPSPEQVDVAGKADAFLAPLPASDAKEFKQLLG